MEDTLFMVALASLVLAATYVVLTRGHRHIEEWERDFLTSDSGGAGTPWQPLRTHHRKHYCNDCKLAFLFIEYDEGPIIEPNCPFCHGKRTSEWTPELEEPVDQPSSVKERERVAETEDHPSTAAKTAVATPPEDDDPWKWWMPLN
jgi:hypothetical protein